MVIKVFSVKVIRRILIRSNIKMSDSIVVVGSSMIDFVCYADRLPKPGETIVGTKFSTNFGGKGSNQCVAAAKLGGKTHMVARVGDDVWGEKYLDNFKAAGVDRTHVKKTEGFNNGIAQIAVSKDAENHIIIVPGANTQLSEADIESARNEIENAAVVVCQLETPVATAMKAMDMATGIFILNGAPGLSEYQKELITTPTIFCVNETEAELFSNQSVRSIDEAKDVAKKFSDMGCNTVIITLGEEGSVFITNDGNPPEHVSCPKVEPVDTTGAGDAFIGALAFFLATHQDISMKDAISAASYVATESTKLPGTQISYPDKVCDDVWGDKYLDNFKAAGVDRTHVKKTGGFNNGITQIAVSKDAENHIIIVPGANTQLSEADIESARKETENAAVVVCQLETPIATTMKAMDMATGIFILNGAPGLSEYQKEVITTPTIFCVNETKAELFSKQSVRSTDEAKDVAKKFSDMGCNTVIITLGEEGSVFITNDGNPPEHVSCPKVEPVDTTGAGDAFIGALAFFLATHQDISMKDAISAASYVATESTKLPGTQISYPDKAILEVDT